MAVGGRLDWCNQTHGTARLNSIDQTLIDRGVVLLAGACCVSVDPHPKRPLQTYARMFTTELKTMENTRGMTDHALT